MAPIYEIVEEQAHGDMNRFVRSVICFFFSLLDYYGPPTAEEDSRVIGR